MSSTEGLILSVTKNIYLFRHNLSFLGFPARSSCRFAPLYARVMYAPVPGSRARSDRTAEDLGSGWNRGTAVSPAVVAARTTSGEVSWEDVAETREESAEERW